MLSWFRLLIQHHDWASSPHHAFVPATNVVGQGQCDLAVIDRAAVGPELKVQLDVGMAAVERRHRWLDGFDRHRGEPDIVEILVLRPVDLRAGGGVGGALVGADEQAGVKTTNWTLCSSSSSTATPPSDSIMRSTVNLRVATGMGAELLPWRNSGSCWLALSGWLAMSMR